MQIKIYLFIYLTFSQMAEDIKTYFQEFIYLFIYSLTYLPIPT